MIRWRTLGVIPVFLVVVLAWTAAPAFERSTLAIVTRAGQSFAFEVEVATTERERAQGLQGRRSLAADVGMLFDFGRVGPVYMWMKNTHVSLDMIFIAADGAIVNIAASTVPESLSVIESKGPVRGVLEVPAGTAARLGIRPGDRVRHPMFGH